MQVAKGNVAESPFARTVYSLGANRFTGDLVLTQNRKEYRTSWENGHVVAAVSASPADSPGRVALAQGLVNSSTLGIFVRRISEEPALDPVELLTSLAKLSPEQSVQLRYGVLARAASRMFGLPTADFVVDNARTMRADARIPAMDLRWLIYLGLKTHYSTQRLQTELAVVGKRGLMLTPQALPMVVAFGFTDAEEPVLQRLKSKELSLENLINSCPEVDASTIHCMVYALMACNYLAVGNPQSTAPSLTPTPPDEPTFRSPAPFQPVPTPKPTRGHSKLSPAMREQATLETIALIKQQLQVLDAKGSHYKLLNVSSSATDSEIRKGYFKLARRLHPDRLQAVGIDADSKDAQRLFAAINKAFAVLSNRDSRDHYKKVLAAGGEQAYAKEQHQAEEMALRIFRAEEHFRVGEMALRRGQYAHAEKEFQQANELSPEESEYLALYTWAAYCNAKNRENIEGESLAGMSKALHLNSKSPTTRLYHAKLLKLMGRNDEAVSSFQKLLRIDPNNREAKLELRLLKG